MKVLIRKARVNDKNMKLEELRKKSEDSSKEWYRFIQGKGREESSVEEIVAKKQRVQGKMEIGNAVKELWEKIRGIIEPEVNTDMNVLLKEYDMNCLDCDITIGGS